MRLGVVSIIMSRYADQNVEDWSLREPAGVSHCAFISSRAESAEPRDPGPGSLPLQRCGRDASAAGSERLQERYQVLGLLFGEANCEALVVEIHDIRQCGGGAVLEVRRPRRQSAQNRSLHLSNIRALSADERFAQIGHGKRIPRAERAGGGTGHGEDRQPGNVECRRSRGRDPDIDRELLRMVPDVGRIMAGATGPDDRVSAERIARKQVEPVYAANRDRLAVEQYFAARDRRAFLIEEAEPRQVLPWNVKRENLRRESR